jgi:hypothetical protein
LELAQGRASQGLPRTRQFVTTLPPAFGDGKPQEHDLRNAAFTLMLRDSNRKCNQVIRTLFNGTVLGVDEWEALCRDRNSYSISVLAELNDAIITSLSCRELLATSKMMLHRAGSKSKATGCRIK